MSEEEMKAKRPIAITAIPMGGARCSIDRSDLFHALLRAVSALV